MWPLASSAQALRRGEGLGWGRAPPRCGGTMVDRRETLEEVLDGGRKAFRARKDFYEGGTPDDDKKKER